jgi:hypothetical protein
MSAHPQAIAPSPHTNLLNVYIQITNKMGFQESYLGPPLHTPQQPHGTTRPQATETSAHQISCVNVVLDIVVLVM